MSALPLPHNDCQVIIKYLKHMTKDDLSLAVTLGYLTESLEVTLKGHIELKDVAMIKRYPEEPKLTALDKLFM